MKGKSSQIVKSRGSKDKKMNIDEENTGGEKNMEKSSKKVQIREIKANEIQSAAELIARLKKLNGEFDPLLKVSEEVEADARKTLATAAGNKDSVVLVALDGGRVVGVVKADLVDRIFYEPRKEGAIVEFYILPEFRRGNLGYDLLTSMVDHLKQRGAVLITAEFPSQNEIAKKFYSKLGFRSLTNVYAKSYLES